GDLGPERGEPPALALPRRARRRAETPAARALPATVAHLLGSLHRPPERASARGARTGGADGALGRPPGRASARGDRHRRPLPPPLSRVRPPPTPRPCFPLWSAGHRSTRPGKPCSSPAAPSASGRR